MVIDSSKDIGLKPSEEQKILDFSRRLGSEIAWLKDKSRKLVEQKDQKRKKIDELFPELSSKKKTIEDDVKGMIQELSYMDTESKNITKEKKTLEEKIQTQKKEIESLILENIGEKVLIRNLKDGVMTDPIG